MIVSIRGPTLTMIIIIIAVIMIIIVTSIIMAIFIIMIRIMIIMEAINNGSISWEIMIIRVSPGYISVVTVHNTRIRDWLF